MYTILKHIEYMKAYKTGVFVNMQIKMKTDVTVTVSDLSYFEKIVKNLKPRKAFKTQA